jgi:hypothetical protein
MKTKLDSNEKANAAKAKAQNAFDAMENAFDDF